MGGRLLFGEMDDFTPRKRLLQFSHARLNFIGAVYQSSTVGQDCHSCKTDVHRGVE